MTQRVQELNERLSRLPEAMQDQWATRFLYHLDAEMQETESETTPDETQRYWLGGRKPTREEAAEAARRIKEQRKGRLLGDDLTIREPLAAF